MPPYPGADWLWLSKQSGPISGGVTRKSGDHCTNIYVQLPPPLAKGSGPSPFTSFPPLFLVVTLSLAPFSPLHPCHSHVNGVSRLPYFNMACGGSPGPAGPTDPPGKRRVARQPSPPLPVPCGVGQCRGTNLKAWGHRSGAKVGGQFFWSCPSTFWL